MGSILPLVLTVGPTVLLAYAVYNRKRGGLLKAALILKVLGTLVNMVQFGKGITFRFELDTVLTALTWLMVLFASGAAEKGNRMNLLGFSILAVILDVGAFVCSLLTISTAQKFGMLGANMVIAVMNLVALILICRDLAKPVVAEAVNEADVPGKEELAYRQMLQDGIITQEEFDAWKRQSVK